jgi:hypothetical protein
MTGQPLSLRAMGDIVSLTKLSGQTAVLSLKVWEWSLRRGRQRAETQSGARARRRPEPAAKRRLEHHRIPGTAI